MTTRQHRQSRLRRLWLPVVAALFLSYFGYHAFHGSFGIWARESLEAQTVTLEKERADIVSQREHLERRVALLRSESLDPDLIDELARQNLNMLQRDEVVIYRK